MCFIWFLINQTRYKKEIKKIKSHFCVKNLKLKRKEHTQIFDLLQRGFESQIFSNFPTHDLNFHGKRPEIKSKQASKRVRALRPSYSGLEFFIPMQISQHLKTRQWWVNILMINLVFSPKQHFYTKGQLISKRNSQAEESPKKWTN